LSVCVEDYHKLSFQSQSPLGYLRPCWQERSLLELAKTDTIHHDSCCFTYIQIWKYWFSTLHRFGILPTTWLQESFMVALKLLFALKPQKTNVYIFCTCHVSWTTELVSVNYFQFLRKICPPHWRSKLNV
jgi:hypothetical protein